MYNVHKIIIDKIFIINFNVDDGDKLDGMSETQHLKVVQFWYHSENIYTA